MQSEKVNEIFAFLKELFGDVPRCELFYRTDIEFLVAIILSAQCTDKRVNSVTKILFERYKSVQDYADADSAELEQIIRSCGFYRSKAKNIIKMAQAVVNKHGGTVPADMEALVRLCGVGRKSASVFLSHFHNIPALAVDTHVMRVSRRLGICSGDNPLRIERELSQIFDKQNWCDYHLYLVLFGRYFCKARGAMCGECKVKRFCSRS